ncbi:MAG: DoxX family membrane protein [Lutibacter sp.]|uniref:DoxX family membrane protein n=1 Tax=Lutibacter sp. TaxID=1925666 RepID=UPI0017E26E30|nr:DoxX family membrane protein [Lutibacter sp.]MBT8317727.1 DoxX family membrane protein [Lutibacter sp.]NNJ58585.1 DoxX family membrane protein [Lutibacter sp.]
MNSKLTMVFRLLLGLILVVFGANKFFHFLPMPTMEGPPADFMGALINSGYMFPLIGVTEVVAGLLLIINKWTGLALILTAIISTNIILFHLVLAPAGIILAAVVAILNIILMYANWKKFKTLF